MGGLGPGQALVRHSYVAVNFIDIHFRTGVYPLALPNGLGEHVLAGRIVGKPKQEFALADAARAHQALKSRQTMSTTVLVPWRLGVSRLL